MQTLCEQVWRIVDITPGLIFYGCDSLHNAVNTVAQHPYQNLKRETRTVSQPETDPKKDLDSTGKKDNRLSNFSSYPLKDCQRVRGWMLEGANLSREDLSSTLLCGD